MINEPTKGHKLFDSLCKQIAILQLKGKPVPTKAVNDYYRLKKEYEQTGHT